jgi:uncharacterized protein
MARAGQRLTGPSWRRGSDLRGRLPVGRGPAREGARPANRSLRPADSLGRDEARPVPVPSYRAGGPTFAFAGTLGRPIDDRVELKSSSRWGSTMEFDTFTVVLLEARPDAPRLGENEANALQDAHMAHLATLHEDGNLQAAGPVVDPPGSSVRGLCLHRLPAEEVRRLLAEDPAVKAGRLTARILTWTVPKGAISFSRTRFPHSQDEL